MNNIYKELSTRRKKLQEDGLVPNWYSTGGLQMFEQKYEYQTNGRSVCGQFERIAKTAANHLVGTRFEAEAESKFFELLWNGWLSPSTPVLANMGTTRGMPVSCSGTVAEDSVDGFYTNLHEVAMLTKHGFGTATDLSAIRPRGSKISVGGKASGILPVVKEHVNAMRSIAQGTARRGAWACYLDIEHGDFYELLDHLSAEGDDLNIGWTVKQSFIDRLNKGDSEAVNRFQKAMKVKMVTGKGYFFFIDKANEKRPLIYKDKGLFINNSQLCSEIMLHNSDELTYTCQPEFATLIKKGVGLSTLGEVNIGDEIWSESGWTKVVNKVSSGIKSVNKYSTPNGVFIGTEDHRVVENGEKIQVKDAESIDGIKYEYQEINGKLHEYIIDGLVTGDGTIRNDKVVLCVGEHDQDYYTSEIAHLIDQTGYSYFRNIKINTVDVTDNTYNRDIDISRLNSDVKIASFLRGLYSSNGSAVIQQDGGVHIVLTATSLKVAEKAQLLGKVLGMLPKIYKQKGVLSNFNNGTYLCKDVYRLVINRESDVEYFSKNIGFIQKYKQSKVEDRVKKKPVNRKIISSITEVDNLGDHEVFHIEVDNLTHTYWTGGLNVSNCVLSSMNGAKYNEWKDTDAAYWATIFLDCVAGEFIQRAKSIRGLEKAVKFTEKSRALGLGLCGIHTLFMQEGFPFESFDAHMLSQSISALIMKEATRATQDMAKELGEPEWCKGYGVRNTHLIAIAPTKSTALLMGGVSEGINPDPAMSYTQTTSAGEVDRTNVVLLELMKKKGVYSKKHIQEITDNQGSVQKVSWLTPEEKEVFKTAFEINQKAVLRLASARALYIDQWQSLNLFFSADEDPNWIAEVHQEAFIDPNILALYYVYTQAGVQASKGECEACQ